MRFYTTTESKLVDFGTVTYSLDAVFTLEVVFRRCLILLLNSQLAYSLYFGHSVRQNTVLPKDFPLSLRAFEDVALALGLVPILQKKLRLASRI